MKKAPLPRPLLVLLALLLGFVAVAALIATVLTVIDARISGPWPSSVDEPAARASPDQIERGRYLTLAGNCAGCHTSPGGAPFAGGPAIETPFGAIETGNLTPDATSGLGGWSKADFWRALHHGVAKDGRRLYPAFPYTSYTRVTREDADAIHAYLQSLPPVKALRRPHRLRFPYDTQTALIAWRALYFEPAVFQPAPDRPAEWNRGAYLVQGLGHCIACHGTRNELGAIDVSRGLSGGQVAGQSWYAPALDRPDEAGVVDGNRAAMIDLLRTGRSVDGSALGPMAEVVWKSTQHLREADLTGISIYLASLTHPKLAPLEEARPLPSSNRADSASFKRGAHIYDLQCAYCHGDQGQGAPGAYPALAGNRAVNMDSALNLVQIIRQGGFLPATAGNPRPYGMPPFGHLLNDREIADVIGFVRGSWGNRAASVSLREASIRSR